MPYDTKRMAAAAAIATALAIPAEGLRQYAYYGPPGILTVCYGHTGNVEKHRKYSLEECNDLLTADMKNAIIAVESCVPGLPENVLAAFADAVYNIGPRVACDTNKSTAARLLKAGRIEEACKQLPKWNKAGGVPLPGLTKRRNAEMTVCLDSTTSQEV